MTELLLRERETSVMLEQLQKLKSWNFVELGDGKVSKSKKGKTMDSQLFIYDCRFAIYDLPFSWRINQRSELLIQTV